MHISIGTDPKITAVRQLKAINVFMKAMAMTPTDKSSALSER